MRLSSVFEHKIPVRMTHTDERAEEPRGFTASIDPPKPEEVPEDLDQRVRQIGEWQLEDW